MKPEECPLCWSFNCKCWAAQGIAARSDETRSGSAVGKSPVGNADAPNDISSKREPGGA